MSGPRYPSLYQINTRVRLTELSQAMGRPATLDDIPDAELDCRAEMGLDWIRTNRIQVHTADREHRWHFD